jgi:membrane protein
LSTADKAIGETMQPQKSMMQRMKDRILSHNLVKFLLRVMKEMSKDNGTTMAAGIAYYGFLSIFPLLLGLIGLLGYFLPSPDLQQQIFKFVNQNIPGAADVITSNIQNVINARGALSIIGILGFLWSGSGIFGALDNAINRARGITQMKPIYIRKPRDIGLTIGFGVLLLISIGVSYALTIIHLDTLPVIGSYAAGIGGRLTAFLIILVMILVLFKIMPNTRTYWRYIWPGALVTAILFEIGWSIFVYYSSNFTNYSLVYGTVGSIIAILVLIYYSAIILILGVEFTHEYSRVRRGEESTDYLLYTAGTPGGLSRS